MTRDLAHLRAQVSAYLIQHAGTPGLTSVGRFDGKLFVAQLTRPTDYYGVVHGTTADSARCGPYVDKMPPNVFLSGPAAAKVTGGTMPPKFDGSSGWYFNIKTGTLYANHRGGADW